MSGPRRSLPTLAAFAGLCLAVAGCPFKFEKEPRENAAPFTFFDSSPPDTTFANEVFFVWLGTDRDSDVVAFQYQLVQTDSLYYFTGGAQGEVLTSIDPRENVSPGEDPDLWSERSLDNFQGFVELDDGWYEMRARSIDDLDKPSDPARHRFFVFFDDINPVPVVIDPRPGTTTPACGRIGGATSWTFFVTASDSSRHAVTPREALQYSYQLRGRSSASCTTHLTDGFTEWRHFPPGTAPIEIGNAPPTLYTDLFDPNCGWELTFRVRDPAGNQAFAPCCISRGTGCSVL